MTTVVAACRPTPIAEGAHRQLPGPTDKLLVAGNQAGAVSAALTWLQNHGLLTLEDPTLPAQAGAEQAMLDRARSLHADQLVLVQVSGDLRAPMVSVRGLDPDTQAVRWSGYARATAYRASPPPDRTARLTCYALAAVWKSETEDRCD
jgi:hypothetical protein